jgi:hypothetical protein
LIHTWAAIMSHKFTQWRAQTSSLFPSPFLGSIQ